MDMINDESYYNRANCKLGLELYNQLNINNKYEIIRTDREDLNIVNSDEVGKFIKENKVDVVINFEAHTDVDLCETDVENTYKINAIGQRNLAIACEKIGSKFVQVSTDYVFDGSGTKPYREDDVTCPNSIYGTSKLMGEQFTKDF